ncbi:MAG TPA: tyrosine-type recombinase/integrase [Thiohalobacter sp.]|nr:tyrosine-type recombinase/integrase [Thiohalobacter sp.]
MKATINSTLIKNLPTGRDLDIYDDRLTGFALRLRKSGRHSYRVNYARGKWYTLGRITDLKPAEAREQAKAVLGDAARGLDIGAQRRQAKASTWREYLNNIYGPWVETHRKDGKATHARLRRLDGKIGSKRLPEITPWLIEKWRSRRTKAGKAASTINRDLVALKSALNRAVEWGLIDSNPIAKVKPAKVDQKGVIRYLSTDEESRLREALAKREGQARIDRDSGNAWRKARGYALMPDLREVAYTDHLRPLILLALNTGLRRGELFNLRWHDVDLDRASLLVRGTGSKSAQSRHVPLNSEAVAVLRAWQETTQQAGRQLVFPGKDGKRLDNITTAWARITRQAKLADFRFHDLRHSFASRLVMAGVDLNVVRELLGHADIKMTLRYAHLAPEHKAQAVERLVAKTEEGAA